MTEAPNYIKQAISIHAPARGGDQIRAHNVHQIIISIHAPARGGDLPPAGDHDPRPDISIHAPARGGDSLPSSQSTETSNFNPRPREGGRPLRTRSRNWF